MLLSVLAYLAFNWAIDGWIGLLVAAVVLKGGFDVCRDTMDSLLGGKPDPEKIRQIRELLLARDGILGIHDLVLHDYGPGRCIASVHAEVSADANIVAIHEVIDDAEREIGQKMHMAICIHMDPIVTSDDKVNHVHQQMSDFLKNTDPCLSLHDFRMVPGQGHINLIFDCVTPAGYKGRDELLNAMPPFLTGGEMIESVTRDGAVFAELPHKFEAGTVNAADAAGLHAAIDYVKSIGFTAMHQQEVALTRRAMDAIGEMPHVHVLGSEKPEEHCGIITFTVDGVHPHDISEILASDGVAIRAGHHCAQPLLAYLKHPSTARASLAFYNTESEVDRLLDSISTLRERMGYGK